MGFFIPFILLPFFCKLLRSQGIYNNGVYAIVFEIILEINIYLFVCLFF